MENIEQKLLLIWQEIIHTNVVDPQQNLLDQGGNSLHFIKLASVVSKAFSITISPSDIFTAGNLSALAKIIQQRQVA
ncbi:acyl carrier protein [Vibrio ruber]|uniref:acyl carrier protein n=1 Tax=Vibrio ruber TaxID=184755 RepID=UPI002893253B|nr:acyl carrier protein [Vibrio ruber]WNJ94140.1 acyl carrier protein [Vibrio ruber]